MTVVLSLDLDAPARVVVLAPHPDDLEIGAGGLLLSLAAGCAGLDVHYVLFSGTERRQAEARSAAAAFLSGARLTFATHDLPDGRLPDHWGAVKQILQDAAEVRPHLVLSPWVGDAHQDHRLVASLATTAFRDAFNLQYEIPKWDGDIGRPNVYVPLSEECAQRKVELLYEHYPSQKNRDWWDQEVFLGLARLRGMECRARYAEAFHCHKAVVTLAG